MAYKLKLVDRTNNFNMDIRFEKMDRVGKKVITYKQKDGKQVFLKEVSNGETIEGKQRVYLDAEGNTYGKEELTFWCGEQEVSVRQKTEIMEITSYEPFKSYTDSFVVDKFYEVYPADNDKKKDFDRNIAIQTNTYEMRRLWEYLMKFNVVGRGELNPTSGGFVQSDGFIRGVEINGAWGLELGIFKYRKNYLHLIDGIPSAVTTQAPQQGTKIKLKMI